MSTNTTVEDKLKKYIDSELFNKIVEQRSDSIVEVRIRLFNEETLKTIIANINKKEYDTEKPVDSLTGKPPLKSETNIVYSLIEANLRKEVETLNKIIVNKDITIDSLTVINKEQSEQIIKIQEQLKSNEKVKKLSFWDNFQIWCFRFLILILILWLVFRFRKKLF